MKFSLATIALFAFAQLGQAQPVTYYKTCQNGQCQYTPITTIGTTAVSTTTPTNVQTWDIVGRGPTQVQVINGQATIVGPATTVPTQAVPTTQISSTFAAEVRETFGPGVPSDLGGAVDALDEVNQWRTVRGYRPFLRDQNLTVGAMRLAEHRARLRLFGHTGNDFAFLPSGSGASATGCAAYPPSYGWMSCAARDNYTYAGAAWAMGADGKRYMHLVVR